MGGPCPSVPPEPCTTSDKGPRPCVVFLVCLEDETTFGARSPRTHRKINTHLLNQSGASFPIFYLFYMNECYENKMSIFFSNNEVAQT